MPEATTWGIHAGKTGDAESLFFKREVVALGFAKMGDLSRIAPDRASFRSAFTRVYPDRKPAAVPASAGQLYRFAHEMQEGDLVVYPSKRARRIFLGRVIGPYQFHQEPEPTYPHHRSVKWIKDVPRTAFSQGALYESGSALSLFQIATYADEFRVAAEGHSAQPAPVQQDETVAAVAEDIVESTRDFVLKKLAQDFKGHPLADFVGHLLNTMGYRTRVSAEGADGGIDIVAHKDELGFEPPIIKVQVKSTEGSIGDPVVSALYGKVAVTEFGLLVTLGTFTSQAKAFAREKANLRLIDGSQLVDLVLDHYEQFDSWYKGQLPLKRVYVPELGDEQAD